MNANVPIECLSQPGRACVLRYYDVPVESPDLTRILYFAFDAEVPGPGDVVVADADGSDPRVVGRAEEAIGHVGGFATWIDDETVAFCPRQQSEPSTVLRSLTGKPDRTLAGNLRSLHEPTGRAAGTDGSGSKETTPGMSNVQTLYRTDIAGGRRQVLATVGSIHEMHPLRDAFTPSMANFQNPKWAPDGESLFVVYGTEFYRGKVDRDAIVIKSLILMDADGSNVRYVGEFSHHPMWTPDGKEILAYRRDDAGRQDLYRFSLDGAEPKRWIEDLPGVHASLHPSGQMLVTDVLGGADGEASILLVGLGDGSRRTLVTARHGNHGHVRGCHPHPQWSRDGKCVLFNLADDGPPQVYRARVR